MAMLEVKDLQVYYGVIQARRDGYGTCSGGKTCICGYVRL